MTSKAPLREVFLWANDRQSESATASSQGTPTQTISFRVTEVEKEQLRRDAAGLSRSAYIRKKLFGEQAKPRKTRGKFPVKDYEALGRVLGMLGRSGIYNNMHRLMLAIDEGRVAMDNDIVAEIRQTHADIVAMRRDLVQALGLQPKSSQ